MTNATRQLDTTELESRVKSMYEQVALDPYQDFHFETGRPLAERLGYSPAELDLIAAESIDSFAGVGYFFDLAALAAGETVLDLGSGSGMDSFLAALAVGRSGTVIGVDMTTSQLDKARRLTSGNVEFRQGYIEEPPVEAGSVDCVISNGVINLPDGVTCDAALWAACIGGAMQADRYHEAIEAAGFHVDTVRENTAYRFVSDRASEATTKYGVTSISLLARRT